MPETMNVGRFIARLDECLNREDMEAARDCLTWWEGEARRLGDARGLLSVLNEAVGFYRRMGERGPALRAIDECLPLLESLGLSESPSGATVLVNAATTLSAFGDAAGSLPLYARAARCFEAGGRAEAYEYAALLNNRANALNALGRWDEAEADWRRAIGILRREGKHDGDIALSLVSLAHLAFDRDENAFAQVEALLDEAWEAINSPRQARDGNYAFILQKCAPSFDYFQRPVAAQAMRDVAKEIYAQR